LYNLAFSYVNKICLLFWDGESIKIFSVDVVLT